MKLVIVESPSKAKTIEKYLGKEYTVDASGGHVRDLPEKTLGVDVKKNFQPKYEINPNKKEVIARLLSKSKKAETVYLATDPDREGEAISWHLAQALNIPLNDKNRIVFNEISQKAVKKALTEPREINVNLVNAQQARRVLDRLVGYKISPFLCKRIQNKLSAGRVQSVALRLIVEREREINEFVPKEYWTVTAVLSAEDGDYKTLTFRSNLISKNGKKYKPENKEQADEVVSAVKHSPFIVKSVKAATSYEHAPAPFTTSTLQQESSNKLSLTSPQTMQIAQELYEGVPIEGEGQIALVTYIRTDSVRISQDAQTEALKFISEKFGKAYVPEKPNFYKSKKSAQDAHEAIRPISLERSPDSLKNKLQRNHYRLYKLIYERFLASQMSEAVYDTLNVEIDSANYTFKSSGKTLKFKGYTAVYEDTKAAAISGEEEEENSKLPPLSEGDKLKLSDILTQQKFTKPPQRFTDASLVKVMEDKGIGRPSTYASIIGVLQKRTYTVKEGKFIKPTELAFSVNDLLIKYFDNIMDVQFTARMEEQLDDIEEGGKDWQALIADFYPWLENKLKTAQSETIEVSDVLCDKCGSNMVVKVGRYGKFLACPNYPECKNIKSLEEPEQSDEVCEKCGSPMIYKNGRYGKYLACSNYPECSNIKSLNKIKEEKSDVVCQSCGQNMTIREGKFGKYLHCADCKISKPINEVVAACPKCGKDVVKRMSKSKKVFYGCTGYPECDFVSWDIPSGKNCPQCGAYTLIRTNKSGSKIICSSKDCSYEEKIEDKQD